MRLTAELEKVKEASNGQMAKTLGEMDKKEDLQKENQKLKDEVKSVSSSSERYRGKYREMKVIVDEKENKVDSLKRKCKDLEDKLEVEKGRDRDPEAIIEKKVAKHKKEIDNIRNMYKADITKKRR